MYLLLYIYDNSNNNTRVVTRRRPRRCGSRAGRRARVAVWGHGRVGGRGLVTVIGYHFICFDACEIGRLKIYSIRIYNNKLAPKGVGGEGGGGYGVFIVPAACVHVCVSARARLTIVRPHPATPRRRRRRR